MARLSGKNGRVYLAIASGGTAEPLPFVAKWNIEADTDRTDVTAMGDSNKVYVSGLPDAQGSVSGWYDDSTAQSYTAALDGEVRKMYIYPNHAVTTKYWFGTGYWDFNVDSDVNGGIAWSATWSAASPLIKVG